jgi:transglutaminase-like putative cysteine protease
MARTIAVFVPPALLIAVAWLRLEDPRGGGADWLFAVLLALAPALAPRLWQRLALAVPAALAALWVALDSPPRGTPPLDDGPGFFEPVGRRFADGVAGFFDVAVPFDGSERLKMHGVLVLAIFGFCLVLAQALAARRPLPAILAVLVGAGWPATLLASQSVLYGALILAAALWVLASLRVSPPVPALAAGAAIVLVAAAASSSAAIAKDGVLAWEGWDPGRAVPVPVSVAYVWSANYGGISFAKEKTTVLRIKGPERGLYWRATTLDQFEADRWLESPIPLSTGPANGPLPPDELLPARARNPRALVRQEVEVVALTDEHVVAAAQPVALQAPQLGDVFKLADGIVRVFGGLERGQRYTAWSYAPRPEPAELARIEARYPAALGRFVDVGRTQVESFGTPGRDARVDALFTDDRYLPLWPYRAVWDQAKRLRAGARTPYGAVVAIETWLRSTGGFVYDETPPRPAGLPPLAHFVATGKRGYCQHFAGAMALMLRFLGIPARVVAGFTSGTREDGTWTVTDHNAHAWVEAWFPGYGWLPFDPTPGRGSLAANYSASSTGFNAGDAAEAFGSGGAAGRGGAGELDRLLQLKEALAERQGRGGAATERRNLAGLWLVLLAVVGAGLAIGGAKLVRRRLRYLTRDPRRTAAAARRELADFLADQGVEIGASATPAELHQLVYGELRADGSRFASALATARFGPPAASGRAAEEARRELRALLRVIRRGLGRWARLRGFVTVRSLRA